MANVMINIFWDDTKMGDGCTDGSIKDAVAKIQALDGHNRTVVLLQLDGMTIGIGGGNNGKVISYCTYDNWNFYNLVGDPMAKGVSQLTAGGQPGHYANRNILSIETAVKAVVELIQQGQPPPKWEIDTLENKKS